MNIVAAGPGAQFDGNNTATKRGHPLGSAMQFADGRRYRYARAGASVALVAAMLNQSTLPSVDFDELVVPTARAIGDRRITVTTGSTGAAVDLLADGYLNVEDDAGEGYLYTIKSNAAAGATAALTIDLFEQLQVAWTTSTTVGIVVNPYALTIIHPSPATSMLTGVSVGVVAVNNYGWLQVAGPASVRTEGTVIINERVIDSASADGAVAPTASTAAGEEHNVGVVMEVAATTEQSLIYLTIS